MNFSSAFGSISSRAWRRRDPATRLSRPIVSARVSSLSAEVVRNLRCAPRLAGCLFKVNLLSYLPAPLLHVDHEGLLVHRVVRSGTQVPDDTGLERAGRHRPVNIQVRLDRRVVGGIQGRSTTASIREMRLNSIPPRRCARSTMPPPISWPATTGASSPQNSTNSASKLAWTATETFNPYLRSDSPNLKRSKAYSAKRSASFGTTLR